MDFGFIQGSESPFAKVPPRSPVLAPKDELTGIVSPLRLSFGSSTPSMNGENFNTTEVDEKLVSSVRRESVSLPVFQLGVDCGEGMKRVKSCVDLLCCSGEELSTGHRCD
eukprot:TRINITY_DN15551_c0_g3_i1.p2 TRINITY_DN15551_c0_g3~~TRINITY_DN15551_c0_g3_i1.p2  ORF type:complete len:110 (+),score=12.34 TRINITY_DN15551_c0_g3_i1:106-435(+)